MNARQRIAGILKEWLVLTQRESHAIQVGHWSELAEIQKKKAGLQPPLTDVLEQWKVENPLEASSCSFSGEIDRLLALESNSSELLAVRKRDIREKILLLEQALFNLRHHLEPLQTA
jgi:outer membrane PBP1 activator LpoA protein